MMWASGRAARTICTMVRDGLSASFELADEMEGDTVAQDIQKFSKALRITIGPQPRGLLLVAARARGQIGGQRPGRAADTQQGAITRAFLVTAGPCLAQRI